LEEARRRFHLGSISVATVISLLPTNMNLQLSEHSFRNSLYCTPEGQTIYKIVTPKGWGARTTSIAKIVTNSKEDDMQDRYEEMAQIRWPWIGKEILKFRGQERASKEYLRRDGVLWRLSS
jgi:hypothetical protein